MGLARVDLGEGLGVAGAEREVIGRGGEKVSLNKEIKERHVTDLTEEEPGLAATLLRVDIARHGEAGHQHLADTQSNNK